MENINHEQELLKKNENSIYIGSKIIFKINLHIVKIKKLSIDIITKIENYLTKFENENEDDTCIRTVIDLIINIYENEKEEELKNIYDKAKILGKRREGNNLFSKRKD
jgi:hypothetical protein